MNIHEKINLRASFAKPRRTNLIDHTRMGWFIERNKGIADLLFSSQPPCCWIMQCDWKKYFLTKKEVFETKF